MAKRLKEWACTPEILCANGYKRDGAIYWKDYVSENADPSSCKYRVRVTIGDNITDKDGHVLVYGHTDVTIRGLQLGNTYDHYHRAGKRALRDLPQAMAAFGIVEVWVEPTSEDEFNEEEAFNEEDEV